MAGLIECSTRDPLQHHDSNIHQPLSDDGGPLLCSFCSSPIVHQRGASNVGLLISRSLPSSQKSTFFFIITMQNGIPASIAQSARCLFRECLRRADYVGSQYGSNSEVVKSLIRDQFRRNMHETDPEKIELQKQVAARALFNHMYYEAGRMAHEHAEASLIKESLLGVGMTLYDEGSTKAGSAYSSSSPAFISRSFSITLYQVRQRKSVVICTADLFGIDLGSKFCMSRIRFAPIGVDEVRDERSNHGLCFLSNESDRE